MTETSSPRRPLVGIALWAGAVALIAIVVAAVALAAFGGDDGGSLDDVPVVVSESLENEVSVVDNEFEPQALRVPTGATVTWRFEGSLPHNVTADAATFESDTVDSGEFAWTFDDDGEFTYECTVHPGMRGVIYVGAPSATP